MALQLDRVFAFLYFQFVLALSIPPPEPQNAIWRYGYKPEPSCNNLFPEETSITEGFFCIDNYVRDDNDQCIYVYDCPQFKTETTTRPSCPAGESYTIGFYPEPSCNDLFPEAKGIKENCYCDDHAVRNPEGKCVSVYECLQYISTTTTTAATPVCPTGEYYTADFYPEPSCDNFYPENVYIKEGCFCKENYIRNTEGKCIEIGQCDLFTKPQPTEVLDYNLRSGSPKCPKGEIFRTGMYPEATCDNPFPNNAKFKAGCFCTRGLVRNSTGKCISKYECKASTTSTPGPTVGPTPGPTVGPTPGQGYILGTNRVICEPGSSRFPERCVWCLCQPDGKTEICVPTVCAPPQPEI